MADTIKTYRLPFSYFIEEKQKEHDHDITRDYALMIKLAGQYERAMLEKMGLPHDWAGWRYGMRWQVWGWYDFNKIHEDGTITPETSLTYVGIYQHTAEHALWKAEEENREQGSPFRNLFRIPIEWELINHANKETA